MIANQETLMVPAKKDLQIPRDVLVGDDWGRIDPHTHLRDASSDIYSMLEEIINKRIISAFTEHDNNGNFSLVWKLACQMGIEGQIMTGTEITVLADRHPAHLLIYFPDKSCVPNEQNYRSNFARGTDSKKAIEAIHDMGGFCIWPHPTSPLTFSVGRKYLLESLEEYPNSRADGLEVLNPTPAGRVALRNAKNLFEKGIGAAVGGSDARKPDQLGRCQTRFPGKTKEDFIEALKAGRTVAEGSFYPVSEVLDIAYRQTMTVVYRAGEMINNVGEKYGG